MNNPVFHSGFNGFRRWFAFGCVMLSVLPGSLRAESASDWRPTTWDGEAAWEATSAGWTAIVSEGRTRLVSISPVGSGDNLLFVLIEPSHPSRSNSRP